MTQRHSAYTTFLAILHFQREHGYAPAVRDLVALTGINSTSLVRRHLHQLEELGLITLEARKARTIRVVEREAVA